MRVMVEIGRVELPSENPFTKLSTSVVCLSLFPLIAAGKQAAKIGSFIIRNAGQSLSAPVGH